MAAQSTIKSWKNRALDGFTKVANTVLGYKSLESNHYKYSMATFSSGTSGETWLSATPTLADPQTYTISKIKTKEVTTIFGKQPERSYNQKMTDGNQKSKLFSLSEVWAEFDKFESDIADAMKVEKHINVINYKLCA